MKIRFIFKMKRIFYILILMVIMMACADEDSFSVSSGLSLEFSTDTVKLDTVFSRTTSSTYTFWVHNRNNQGLKMQSVRLKHGNQSGFRVNVDGIYLDNSNGSQINNIEIRKNDSILVFVEITAPETDQSDPQLISDKLVFLLESGVEQYVSLQAWTWNAVKCYSSVIETDSVIESDKPLVIYGDFIIKEGAHLTLRNTTLYFHADAGLQVYGTLITDSCTMRGDRLDKLFDYLPYDRVPGQWKGIRFYSSSNNNILKNTKIRNSYQGLVCDSAALDSINYRLKLEQCVVHNCQGNGVSLSHAHVRIENSQLSNCMGDCLTVNGGIVEIVYCTLAQFYMFAGGRGSALRFSNQWAPLYMLTCEESIITGYDDDVVKGEQMTEDKPFNYFFAHSLLRTPCIDDSYHFENIIWESFSDSIQGKKHFVKVDEDNLDYDFHLDSLSIAKGLGCYR